MYAFYKKGNVVDLDKAEQELMTAIRAGVNYLDTAYVYPGNETAVGELLSRNHCREEIYRRRSCRIISSNPRRARSGCFRSSFGG